MAQYVKVIQKNKGAFKNFLKKIEQIQDYKATCGIHKDKGRILAKDRAGNKNDINIATLSDILERYITWRQKSTVVIPANDGGDPIVIPQGRIIRKPARIFIHLEKVSNVWAEVQKRIQTQSMLYMLKLQRSRGKRSGQELFLDIANWLSERQRQRITRRETAGNSELTMKIKGFNYPLFDNGTLLSSISGRVVRNSTGRKVRCAYIATDMEKQIAKINSFVR